MEMGKAVQKQLELDFSVHLKADEATKVKAPVFDFHQSKIALELRTKLASNQADDKIVLSRIDSLLARYK